MTRVPGTAGSVSRLKVKVVPGASQDGIAGWLGDELKVRVSAPPEKGRANKAVARLLARALGITEGEVTLASGGRSPRKVFAVHGLSENDINRILARE